MRYKTLLATNTERKTQPAAVGVEVPGVAATDLWAVWKIHGQVGYDIPLLARVGSQVQWREIHRKGFGAVLHDSKGDTTNLDLRYETMEMFRLCWKGVAGGSRYAPACPALSLIDYSHIQYVTGMETQKHSEYYRTLRGNGESARWHTQTQKSNSF